MNLWAEFNNQHQQAPAEPAKPGQTRRLAEQAMLSSVREWLLQDYTSSYCRALAATRIYRRCYWIDAWGIDPGRDKSAPIEPTLQPIVSLSQALARENKPIALNGIVLEGGSSRRKEVKAILNGNADEGEESSSSSVKGKSLKLPKESSMLRASWLEIAPALLKEIEHSPAIFLLNPFGQTLFSYDDLALLYQRKSAPTELCLLIPHKQAQARLLAASRTPANASALTALLRTDRWKGLLPKGESDAEIIHGLDGMIGLLLASMQQHFLWSQRIALLVQARPAVVEAAPYTLLFATRRKDSLFSMNDAVCIYRRRLYEQSLQGILGEDWFATQEQERLAGEIQQLYQQTLRLGQTQRPRRWLDLRQQLLLANFGQFTIHDYDEIINKLIQHGEVRCEWRRKPSQDDENRIPGNDDTLLWK